MSFLKAEWKNLILINYKVDPEILRPYIPKGTELDLWEGSCYLSLVGFLFVNTRLKGIKIPFHANFEEVNLRFYVKRKSANEWKRGVVFIKEIVPKPAITFVANTVYKENYETMPMNHIWEVIDGNKTVEYQWKKDNNWNSIKVVTEDLESPILEGTKESFIAEHYWGYAKINNKHTNEYEVKHPKWSQYKVKEQSIDVDFEKTYGREFTFLKELSPSSIFLAVGSEISVENKKNLHF